MEEEREIIAEFERHKHREEEQQQEDREAQRLECEQMGREGRQRDAETTDADEPKQRGRCLSCGQTGTLKQTCKQCTQALYCSLGCRLNHWKQHEPVCSAVMAERLRHTNQQKVRSTTRTTAHLLLFARRLLKPICTINFIPCIPATFTACPACGYNTRPLL